MHCCLYRVAWLCANITVLPTTFHSPVLPTPTTTVPYKATHHRHIYTATWHHNSDPFVLIPEQIWSDNICCGLKVGLLYLLLCLLRITISRCPQRPDVELDSSHFIAILKVLRSEGCPSVYRHCGPVVHQQLWPLIAQNIYMWNGSILYIYI